MSFAEVGCFAPTYHSPTDVPCGAARPGGCLAGATARRRRQRRRAFDRLSVRPPPGFSLVRSLAAEGLSSAGDVSLDSRVAERLSVHDRELNLLQAVIESLAGDLGRRLSGVDDRLGSLEKALMLLQYQFLLWMLVWPS